MRNHLVVLPCGLSSYIEGDRVLDILINSKLNITDVYVTLDGRVRGPMCHLVENQIIRIAFRGLGGKGGFGATLRGGKSGETTNTSSMRTLDGERVLNVETKEALKCWESREDTMSNEEVALEYSMIKHGLKHCNYGASCRYRKTCSFVHPKDPDVEMFEVDIRPVEYFSETRIHEALVSGLKYSGTCSLPEAELSNDPMPTTECTEQLDMSIDVSTVAQEESVNWDLYPDSQSLEVLGADKIKSLLQKSGLKCGGTLSERASRLFLLKFTRIEDIPSNCKAKSKKRKLEPQQKKRIESYFGL